MSKPSRYHSNRMKYNWLIYDIADKWLEEYSKYYRGVLVDLGCGEAPYKKYFLQYANEYIGVDWTKTLHNSKADVLSNLNKKIALEDDFADTIISLSVIEHLCEPQIFLNESYRILKEDGTMILAVPFMWWIHEAPHDYFRYTPYGLKYIFEKAGFKDIHVQPTTGFFTMLFLKMNYFSLRWIKGSKFRQFITKQLLRPFWYFSQKLAPLLDSMHRSWSLETQSFYVIAKKRKTMNTRLCPICNEASDEFLSFGFNLRQDAQCPVCLSLERDRLIWLYLKKKGMFLKNKKMLHIAPEKIFVELFQEAIGNGYISGDIEKNRAMVEMDITDINYKDESFDYIYCSHVLEHIIDDEKAINELHRVLKGDGWAILNVPIMTNDKTFEDYSIIDPEERMKIYGHPEHVRNYGNDYKDRLINNGFNVEVISSDSFLSNDEIIRMGITSAAGEIYFCRKTV